MAIRFFSWDPERARGDLHVLAGTTSRELLEDLVVVPDTGPALSAAAYLANWTETVIDFTPLFRHTPLPTTRQGHGLTVSRDTGAIEADAGPVRIRNFMMEITIRDNAGATPFTLYIRVHVHGSIQDVWLTPASLTVHPAEHPRAQRQVTWYRFAVRAQFDDGTVGELTDPDIDWSGPAAGINVTASGRLCVEAADPPGQTVTITAALPARLGGATRSATMNIGPAWNQVQRTAELLSPGATGPVESVPNVLFIPDGFTQADRAAFDGLVDSLVAELRTRQLTRPFDVLAGSVNYWKAFVASPERGISVRGEVYPRLEEKPTPGQGHTVAPVPGPAALPPVPYPPGHAWTLENLVWTVGLPTPADGVAYATAHQEETDAASRTKKVNQDIRAKWKELLKDEPPKDRVPDYLLEAWKKLAWRTRVAEVDTFPGLAFGGIPGLEASLLLHPGRGGMAEVTRFCTGLTNPAVSYAGAYPVGVLWGDDRAVPAADRAAHPATFANWSLIVILTSHPCGRAHNTGQYMTLAPQRAALETLPRIAYVQNRNEAVLVPQKIPSKMPGLSWRGAAHELAHSLGLGDEYETFSGTYPFGETGLAYDANLQTDAAMLVPGTVLGPDSIPAPLDPARIRWNWHRVRKAAVLTAAPVAGGPGTFRIPVRPADARRLAAGDDVLLRERAWDRVITAPPRRDRPWNEALPTPPAPAPGAPPPPPPMPSPPVVLEKTLVVAEDPTGGEVVVKPGPGVSLTPQELQQFGAGSLLFVPVPATPGPGWARMISPAVAKRLASGALSGKRDVRCQKEPSVPASPELPGVTLPPGLERWHLPRIVGAYQGGGQFACGVMHPAGTCMMRGHDSSAQFCAVCRYVIVDLIDPSKHAEMDEDYARYYLT